VKQPETEIKYPAPFGLDESGSALWVSIASEYKMRPDELQHLEDACRLVDIMASLRVAAQGQPMMIPGSTGQMVLNPLIAEQKTHALAVGTLLARCKLPDLDAPAVDVNQQRDAANVKHAAPWAGRGA
jgi:hypothetical protein